MNRRSVAPEVAQLSSAEASPLLEVSDMSVRYPNGTTAVKEVSFSLEAGERVALVGESGSGKSTLALAIAGFLTSYGTQIESKTLRFQGKELDRHIGRVLPRKTPGISMVLQDAMTSLDPVWTIESQLLAAIRAATGVRGKAARKEGAEWLRKVGLTDTERVFQARPYELSGGMRQRAMMAIALCGGPSLVIADEPTSALDASLATATMDLLLSLTQEFGSSLLVVSHDIDLTMRYCDRILVMYQGELVEQGTADELHADPKHPYSRALLRCVPTLGSAELEFLPTLESEGFVGSPA